MLGSAPLYPELTVALSEQEGKPVARVAMVRRALQKAGHQQSAMAFTDEALASDSDDLLAIASKYVRVV